MNQCLFRVIKFVLLIVFTTSLAFAATSSSNLGPLSNTGQVYRCYGTSNTTKQDTDTLTYTGYWRCDGKEVTNEYITCPTGYVSVGVYTWYYTDGWGNVESRCRSACSKVTAYSPASNCRWENP